MTCCIMKNLLSLCAAAAICLASVNSCIFEGYRYMFWGSVWCSDDVPLGPFEVSELSLEFMPDGQIVMFLEMGGDEIAGGAEELTLNGRYCVDGDTAVLRGLSVSLAGNEQGASRASGSIEVTFVEAHLSGETLFLLWRVEDTLYPFTTPLQRPVN